MIMIIIHHVANHLYLDVGSYSGFVPSIRFMQQLGYLGSGGFFFVSGYGMVCSLRKNEINSIYIKRKIINLYFPFLCSWICCLISYIFTVSEIQVASLMHDFLTLGLPSNPIWFFKEIIFLYLMTLILYKLHHNEKNNIGILLIAVVLWVLIAYFSGLNTWWWNSTLCFPLGMICAHKIKWIIDNEKSLFITALLIFVISNLLYFFVHSSGLFQIGSSMCFSFILITIIKHLPFNIKFINYIGEKSLYYYLLQTLVFTTLCLLQDFWLLSLLTIAVCTILSFVFVGLQRAIGLK